MINKNQVKFVKSLQQKKFRNRYGMFVVEGVKSVMELMRSEYVVENVYTTDLGLFQDIPGNKEEISQDVLRQLSGLMHPNRALAVVRIPKVKRIDFNDWILALDDVRDPGNLGTIIRLCDWFGFKHLVCSATTVDCYNPKVLQATMGSIARVNIGYTDLDRFLEQATVPIYGAFLNGTSVYSLHMPGKGILVMGNEANGISSPIEHLIAHKVSIPSYGDRTAESLNVGTATAILLSEIRREGAATQK